MKNKSIYFFNDFDSVTDEMLALFCNVLPLERQERIRRYRRPIDKKLSAMSYIILLYALAKDYGIINPEISIGHHGKPYLADYPNIYFNISHCIKGCVCVVLDTRIGVDIQEVRPYSADVAERVCSIDELERIEKANDKALEFTRIWAMKESYVKMTGEGISDNLKSINVSDYKDNIIIYEKEDIVISVCYKV